MDSVQRTFWSIMENLFTRSYPEQIWRYLPTQKCFAEDTFEIEKDGCGIVRKKILLSLLDYIKGKYKGIHDRFLPFEPFDVCLSYIDRVVSVRRFKTKNEIDRIELEVGLCGPTCEQIFKDATLAIGRFADDDEWRIIENRVSYVGARKCAFDTIEEYGAEDMLKAFYDHYVDGIVRHKGDSVKNVLKDI